MKIGIKIAVGFLLVTSVFAQTERKLQRFQLGGDGSWDYLTYDTAGQRVFIARSTRVMVVDANTGKLSAEIPDTEGVHGVALAHDLGKGFTSNGRSNSVTVFDLKTLKRITDIKLDAQGPDAILYDPYSQQVFTFNARSKDSSVIDAKTLKQVGTIPLGSKPEFAASDGKGKVFVNLEDKNSLAAIDAKSRKVLSTWPIEGCEEPSGLAFDIKNERLFSGCSNKTLAVVDAKNGKTVAKLPIGEGVDATAYDPQKKLVFSSNGEGTLTVIREDSPDKYAVVENIKTQRGARTMALDPKSHKVYLVTAEFGPAPAATAANPRPRPAILPNSFVMLVVPE